MTTVQQRCRATKARQGRRIQHRAAARIRYAEALRQAERLQAEFVRLVAMQGHVFRTMVTDLVRDISRPIIEAAIAHVGQHRLSITTGSNSITSQQPWYRQFDRKGGLYGQG